jgi:hypothetical protein
LLFNSACRHISCSLRTLAQPWQRPLLPNKSGYDVTIWSFPKTSHSLPWNWKLSIPGVFSTPRIRLHHGHNVFLWL